MKKIVFSAVALLLMVACAREDAPSSDSFKEGQAVTLNVSSQSGTKVSSELAGDGKSINFVWEKNDRILVTVGGKSSEFILKDGIGSASASFEGEMPADGSLFDVQYPCVDPDITNQEYSATEAVPHGKMKFAANNCSLTSNSLKLIAQNAVMRLNLYGKDITVSKIEVNNSVSTFTLNINPAVTLPKAKADSVAFFVIVPTGEYKFSAEVFDASATSISKFATSTQQRIEVGAVLDMPAMETGATSATIDTIGGINNMNRGTSSEW